MAYTYTLRYLDNKDWLRGRIFRSQSNAATNAAVAATLTGRSVEIYAGEGAYRAAVAIATKDGRVREVGQ